MELVMLFTTRMGPDTLCGTILSAGAQFIITHAIPIGAEIVASHTFLSVGTSGTTILMVASFTITIVTISSYATIPITISFNDTIPGVISPFDAVMVAVYNDRIPIATEIIISLLRLREASNANFLPFRRRIVASSIIPK